MTESHYIKHLYAPSLHDRVRNCPVLIKAYFCYFYYVTQVDSLNCLELVAGLDNGSLVVYSWKKEEGGQWDRLHDLLSHSSTVARLALRPNSGFISFFQFLTSGLIFP